MTAPLQFSLFYFGESVQTNNDRTYSLLSAGAKKAEKVGLDAIWTPERHFHPFGGLYPNPFITSAYCSMMLLSNHTSNSLYPSYRGLTAVSKRCQKGSKFFMNIAEFAACNHLGIDDTF